MTAVVFRLRRHQRLADRFWKDRGERAVDHVGDHAPRRWIERVVCLLGDGDLNCAGAQSAHGEQDVLHVRHPHFAEVVPDDLV